MFARIFRLKHKPNSDKCEKGMLEVFHELVSVMKKQKLFAHWVSFQESAVACWGAASVLPVILH